MGAIQAAVPDQPLPTEKVRAAFYEILQPVPVKPTTLLQMLCNLSSESLVVTVQQDNCLVLQVSLEPYQHRVFYPPVVFESAKRELILRVEPRHS